MDPTPLPEISWIDLPGVVNMRDVGGKPTADGRVTLPGVIIRTDNLQDLPETSVRRLVDEMGVTDVVDLRTNLERHETGNGPLKAEALTFHELSMYAEEAQETGIPEDGDEAELPWKDDFSEKSREELGHEEHLAGHYMGYLSNRPDNVLKALRAIETRLKGPEGETRTRLHSLFGLSAPELDALDCAGKNPRVALPQ